MNKNNYDHRDQGNHTRASIDNSVLYQIDAKPLGKSWAEWTTEWWKWLLSIPRLENPAENRTGKCLPSHKYNSKLIFLVGTKGGRAEHKITIPTDTSLLLPVINFTTSFLEEPHLKTDLDLIERAQSDIDDIICREASINEFAIEDISKYRVQSLPFNFVYPEDNLFGIPAGFTRCASDGYWLFIKALPAGENRISVGGACSSGRTSVHVVYDVLVER